MSRRPPLAPRLGATAVVVVVAIVAVLAVGGITGDGPGEDEARLATGPAEGTTTTQQPPATVLGAVIERAPATPAAPAASVPPTTAAPTTAAPTTAAPTTAAPTTAAPTTAAPPPPPPPTTAPAPTTVGIDITTSGGTLSVVVSGPGGSREVPVDPNGGSASLDGLAPGTYQLFARTLGEASEPGPDGTQIGGGVRMTASDQVGMSAGQRLGATFDGTNWTLVLR